MIIVDANSPLLLDDLNSAIVTLAFLRSSTRHDDTCPNGEFFIEVR